MKREINRTDTEKTFLLSEYGKRKLTGYAASFQEIARTLERTEIQQKKAEEKKSDASEEEDGQQEERRSRLYRRGLSENRGIFARNLSEMAEIMAKVAGEVFSYRPFPVQKSKMIVQAMKKEGITVRDLYYIEKKKGVCALALPWKRTGREVF